MKKMLMVAMPFALVVLLGAGCEQGTAGEPVKKSVCVSSHTETRHEDARLGGDYTYKYSWLHNDWQMVYIPKMIPERNWEETVCDKYAD